MCNNVINNIKTQLNIKPDNSRNLLLTIRYDGTNYHGWQIQSNAMTVQEVFQNAVSSIFGYCPDIKGCSRTDSGVHADMYCISMKINSNMDCYKIMGALNAHLPHDIAVYDCRQVSDDFHARYSCKGKQYVYYFYNNPARNPFYDKYALHYPAKLDEILLNKCAQDFLGTYDCTALCSIKSDIEDTVRTITQAKVERNNDIVTFTVSADGFLYNMVRIMAGTLMRIAQEKFDINCIKNIIKSKNRKFAGPTAPAHGLFLTKVFY